MADVRDLVTAALRKIGALAASETPTAEDAQIALDELGRLQDRWSAEDLLLYASSRETFTISANDSTYTIGSGGNVNIVRPVYLEIVNFIETSTDPDTELPLRKLTRDDWARIGQKALTSNYPQAWFYDAAFSSARGTLNFWPVPTATTLQGVLYYASGIVEFTSLNTSVSLPPGYREMIVDGLAVKLLPYFKLPPDQLLMQSAAEAKAIVKRANTRLSDLRFESGACVQGGGGRYDIYSDRSLP